MMDTVSGSPAGEAALSWAQWLGLSTESYFEWIGFWGSAASIVGLPLTLVSMGLSIWVAFKVADVKGRLVVNSRWKEIIEQAALAVKEIEEKYPSFAEHEHEIFSTIKVSVSVLKRNEKGMAGDVKNIIKGIKKMEGEYVALLSKIRKGKVISLQERKRLIWDIGTELRVFMVTAEDMVQNRQITGGENG